MVFWIVDPRSLIGRSSSEAQCYFPGSQHVLHMGWNILAFPLLRAKKKIAYRTCLRAQFDLKTAVFRLCSNFPFFKS